MLQHNFLRLYIFGVLHVLSFVVALYIEKASLMLVRWYLSCMTRSLSASHSKISVLPIFEWCEHGACIKWVMFRNCRRACITCWWYFYAIIQSFVNILVKFSCQTLDSESLCGYLDQPNLVISSFGWCSPELADCVGHGQI